MESPYKASEKYTVEENLAFARAASKWALSNGYNPFAMHLYFPQFLDDSKPEERTTGIECGLEWTAQASALLFFLRKNEALTSGMIAALDANSKLPLPRPVFIYEIEDPTTFKLHRMLTKEQALTTER